MRISIIVDANPLISALIGGFAREVLFNHNFNFITTEFTIKEVEKYLPYIAGKTELPIGYIKLQLGKIPLTILSEEFYRDAIPRAKPLIKDSCDIDILALALFKNCPLWSEDKNFEGIKKIVLVKTKDFV